MIVESLLTFTAEDDTVGVYSLVATDHKVELEEYLREVRVPFTINPNQGYESRQVRIQIPNGFELFAFGRNITMAGLHEHLAHIFDGYDFSDIFCPINEQA